MRLWLDTFELWLDTFERRSATMQRRNCVVRSSWMQSNDRLIEFTPVAMPGMKMSVYINRGASSKAMPWQEAVIQISLRNASPLGLVVRAGAWVWQTTLQGDKSRQKRTESPAEKNKIVNASVLAVSTVSHEWLRILVGGV